MRKIDRIKDHPKLHESHFLERLRYLFIRHCDGSIIDDEFARLKNDKAIAYYKMFFENRKLSLKENISREVAYFQRRVAEGDSLMYIGESYGERAYAATGRESYHNVYIDLSRKTSRQLANIAIVKQKIEEDFVSFKLRMFFQLMLDYSILNEDEYYEILYGTTDRKKIYLVKTSDGVHYDLVTALPVEGFPNETTVRMLSDGRMAMMIRRDQSDVMGYWGISSAPFTDWTFTKMEFRIGGPDFISLDDGHIIAGARSYYIPSCSKTVLYRGDETGRFQEVLVLPSGGDTSYPGFLVVGDELWVSYYSSHETKNASIYLARIPLSVFDLD